MMFSMKKKKYLVGALTAVLLSTGAGLTTVEAAPNDPVEAVLSQVEAEDVVDMVVIGTYKVEQIIATYKNPTNRVMLINAAKSKGEDEIAGKLEQMYAILNPNTDFADMPAQVSVPNSYPGSEEFKMGVAYGSGVGQRQDDLEAFALYKKAAEMGHAKAMAYVGLMYEYGNGTDKCAKSAREWYKKSAETGDAYGEYQYGKCLMDAKGGAVNVKEGMEWLEKSAAQNCVGALVFLGKVYETGNYKIIDNVNQTTIKLESKEKAVEYYRKARDTGKAYGQHIWGWLYDDGSVYRSGYDYLVKRDEVVAAEWYLKAAEQEYPKAMQQMIDRYSYGDGVARDSGKSDYWRLRKNAPLKNLISHDIIVWDD